MIPLPTNLTLKLAAGLCAILMLALLLHDRNRWKSTAQLRQQQVAAEKAAHASTVANYRAAAEQARREDAETLARVKAEQSAINERTAHDYESRIAAARADAHRLRRQAESAAADSSRRRTAPVPGFSASAPGTAQGAGEDELPEGPSGTGPAGDPMTISDRLIATEQAIQLDELIKWIRAQSKVSPHSSE